MTDTYLPAVIEEAQKANSEAGTYKRKDGNPEGWREVMTRTTSKPPPEQGRYQLREILLEQGFKMK
jgi:hypothetical protein